MADALRSPVSQGPPANAVSPDARTVARMPRAVAEAAAPVRIDDAALKRIERTLAFHIGPIARHVVREAARKATSIATLCDAVSQHIGPDDEREQFLTACLPAEQRRPEVSPELPNAPAPDQAAGGDAPGTITAEQIERAERALAGVLGPIAKMMVRRALSGVGSEAALWERLATYIEDASDRGEFLRHKARRPPGKPAR
jgi:eukaryotic-like serine/threonine-protein kinase